jgi:hypothetical protein
MVESDVSFEGPKPPPLRNLITLHDPSGERPAADHPLLLALGMDAAEVAVGNIDKVRRLRAPGR